MQQLQSIQIRQQLELKNFAIDHLDSITDSVVVVVV